MSFYIDHPAEWIGVPETWPYASEAGQALDPESWIGELSASLPEEDDLDGREHVQQVLLLAVQRSLQTGLRTFVGFEAFSGPAYVVEAGTLEGELAPGQTLQQFAGLDDPRQVAPPFAEEFTTASGLVGARCYRYLAQEEASEAVYGRVDYVFAVGRSILFLRGAERDLVSFDRLKPRIELLANTVVWRD